GTSPRPGAAAARAAPWVPPWTGRQIPATPGACTRRRPRLEVVSRAERTRRDARGQTGNRGLRGPGLGVCADDCRRAGARKSARRQEEPVGTTLPHADHPAVAMAALDAGLHVLVEKPAAAYTKQVRELIEAADAKPELTFAIMFNQRTNPLYRRIKEIVDAGEIGAIRRSTWTITTWWRPQGYYAQSAWRATGGGEGGGGLGNQSPHQLDQW